MNLMITMLLAGLWHGAAWTYVIWGGIYGLLLIGEHLLGRFRYAGSAVADTWTRWFKIFLTFHTVCLLWVLFRCRAIEDIWVILARLYPFNVSAPMTHGMLCAILIMAGGFLAQAVSDNKHYVNPIARLPIAFKCLVYAFILMLMTVASGAGVKPFIYFQF